MYSFFLTAFRLLKAVVHKWRDPEFRSIMILLCLLLLSGTIFYASIEGWSWLDSLYFSVITLSTVGYGDLSPKTSIGKIFTMIYIFVGLGLFIAIIRRLADDMMNDMRNRRDKRNKK
jgi:voltage-gated potassium channel